MMSDSAAAAGNDKPDTKEKKATRLTPAGVGVGVAIGSAAIVAALLYANRAKKNDKKG